MRRGARPARTRAVALAAGLAAVLTAWPLCTGDAAPAPSPRSVVTYAELAGQAPNYVFPFMTLAHYCQCNTDEFQYLMYRPLYWFGTAHSITLDARLSLARAPVFSDHDRGITIHLKPYRWSDGERVDATDVLFWLNLWHVERTRELAWVPGGLSIPTNVKRVRLEGPGTIELELRHSVNPTWFLYNQLSSITPLPLAWTRTSADTRPGSAGCARAPYGTADAACRAVFDFLSEQSGYNPTVPTTKVDMLSTFASNPLWQVVDGPWRLESFGATAPTVFVPNRHYSGPNKPRIAEFVEEPFTSTTAELGALEHRSLDVGYLPAADVGARTGRALTRSYRFRPVFAWEINFLSLNFRSTGGTGSAGPIFAQRYVRQAMQLLIDQPALIRTLGHGYGAVGDGPVPHLPRSPFLSALERRDPYAFDPGLAEGLLRSHGWDVTPGGTDVCQRPGDGPRACGPGVPAGAKLVLTIVGWNAQSTPQEHGLVASDVRNWSRAGIHVTSTTSSFASLEFPPTACPPGCTWEITGTRGSWTYLPDIYPSGEDLFTTGKGHGTFGDNIGRFATPRNTKMIEAADATAVPLHPWEDYIAKALPVLFQPQLPQRYSEIVKPLHATEAGPLGEFTPATWTWSR